MHSTPRKSGTFPAVKLPLIVDPRQRFTCTTKCPECCRGWRIQVTPEEKERILAHDWARHDPQLAGRELIEERRSVDQKGAIETLAQIDGHCVFLQDDGLCLIHKTLGAEVKPQPCRTFPFLFHQTPDGVQVTTSLGCPAIQRNEGELVSEDMPALQKLYDDQVAWTRQLAGAPGDHRTPVLTGRQSLAWPDYRTWETFLLERLNDTSPASGGLAQALAIAGEALREAELKVAVGALPEGEELRLWLASFTPAAAGAGPAPRAKPSTQRALVAPLVALIEKAVATSGSARPGLGLLLQALSIARRQGSFSLPSVGAVADLARMPQIRFPQDEVSFDQRLRRFLRIQVLRKALLTDGNLCHGYRYLLLQLAALRWYAVAVAADRGNEVVAMDDLDLAERKFDKYFSSQNLLGRFLAAAPLFGALLNRAYEALASPGAIAANPFPELAESTPATALVQIDP